MKAEWNGKVLVESDDTVYLEGNHYFPVSSINKEFFESSETKTKCPWKGEASYYNINVDGKINKDAAWFYANPKEEANNISGRVAFWKGVSVS